jgi:hypothetical protein
VLLLIADLGAYYNENPSDCQAVVTFETVGTNYVLQINCMNGSETDKTPLFARWRNAGNLQAVFTVNTDCDCTPGESQSDSASESQSNLQCLTNYSYEVFGINQSDGNVNSIEFDGFVLDSGTPGFNFPYHIFPGGYGMETLVSDLQAALNNEVITQCCDGIDEPVNVTLFYDGVAGSYNLRLFCINEEHFANGWKPLNVLTSDELELFVETENDPECCTDDCRNYQYTAVISKPTGDLTEISLVNGTNLTDAAQFTFPYDLSIGTERTRFIDDMDAWLIANDYENCCADPFQIRSSIPDIENDFDPAFETGLVRLTIFCVASTLPGFLSFDTVDGGGLFMKVEVPEDNCCYNT